MPDNLAAIHSTKSFNKIIKSINNQNFSPLIFIIEYDKKKRRPKAPSQ